ncbi:hypothetical protein BH11ARM1_BH11ARM1_09160 [soil metagenome]
MANARKEISEVFWDSRFIGVTDGKVNQMIFSFLPDALLAQGISIQIK